MQQEKEILMAKGEKAFKNLQSLKSQLVAIDEDDFSLVDAQRPLPTNNFDFLKEKLHDLLNQVDPKYVPPLGTMSFMPIQQPLGAFGDEDGTF